MRKKLTESSVASVFSKMGKNVCLKNHWTLSMNIYISSPRQVKTIEDNVPRKKFIFQGADADTTYTVKVTLVLNGRAIATAQKKIKALTEDQQNKDEKHNLMVSQLNLQSFDDPSILKAGGVGILTKGLLGNKDDEDIQLEEETDLLNLNEFALDGEMNMDQANF